MSNMGKRKRLLAPKVIQPRAHIAAGSRGVDGGRETTVRKLLGDQHEDVAGAIRRGRLRSGRDGRLWPRPKPERRRCARGGCRGLDGGAS